jgi:D-glycero-D-manno-heptose 1,7-bisphosphate phosphatase
MQLNGSCWQKVKRAIFLDRDGVINKAFLVNGIPKPAKTLYQVQILPRVREAVEILISSGFEMVVVSNQPDVARGNLAKSDVEQIHKYLQSELKINHFYTCFHDDADDCQCRKPKPGLLTLAAEELGLDLNRSFLIGDRWRDIGAGQAAGCRCFFIDYSYGEEHPGMPFLRVSSLFEAANIILEEDHDTIGR